MNHKQRKRKHQKAVAHQRQQAERKAAGHVPVHRQKQPKKPKES